MTSYDTLVFCYLQQQYTSSESRALDERGLDIPDVQINTMEPLYKTVHCKSQFQIEDRLNLDPKTVVSKQRCIDYIEK